MRWFKNSDQQRLFLFRCASHSPQQIFFARHFLHAFLRRHSREVFMQSDGQQHEQIREQAACMLPINLTMQQPFASAQQSTPQRPQQQVDGSTKFSYAASRSSSSFSAAGRTITNTTGLKILHAARQNVRAEFVLSPVCGARVENASKVCVANFALHVAMPAIV